MENTQESANMKRRASALESPFDTTTLRKRPYDPIKGYGATSSSSSYTYSSRSREPATTTNEAPIGGGARYLIRHRETGKYLVLAYGYIKLQLVLNSAVGSHWQCLEKEGWLEICNTVSGGYLGIMEPHYLAVMDKQLDHGRFIARAHPAGGFELLVLDDGAMRRIDLLAFCHDVIADSSEGLGAAWDFIKVG